MRTYRLSNRNKETSEFSEMPLVGPSTYEEAIERIEQAEQEMDEDGGIPWETVLLEAKQRVGNYEVAFY